VITTDAMNELCALMKHRQLTPEIFGAWVSRHYAWIGVQPSPGLRAEPRSVASARERVKAFDEFLLGPRDGKFLRTVIDLRNVFALYAGMSTPVTVVLNGAVEVPADGWSMWDELLALLFPPSEPINLMASAGT
jgi:hypothetical protein